MFFFHKYPSKYRNEIQRLTNDLEQIAKREDFLSERPGGLFDTNCRHIHAREIGKRLSEIGGIALMEDTVRKITKQCGKDLGAHLEFCWIGIDRF